MSESTVLVDKLKKGLEELERQRNSTQNEASRYKLGRILTIVDSSIADPEQRKATKDLVNNAWYADGVLNEMNSSLEALLFEAITGDKLWDVPAETSLQQSRAERWNPFKDTVNK